MESSLENNLGDPKSKPIVIDTNGLLMPFQFRLNLDLELDRLFGFWDILVPECVIAELNAISRTDRIANAALRLAERWKRIETELSGDDGVLEALEKADGILLTNDRELRKRAIKRGFRVVYLRSRKYLKITGE